MNQHRSAIPLLASFPDLNEDAPDASVNKTAIGLLASSSRMIGQALSIKLLAGTALFLLVGAVLPFCLSKAHPPADSPADNSVATEKARSAEVAPATVSAVAPTANRPPVLVAAKEPSAAPAMLPPSSESQGKPQPIRTADASQVSHWNPASGELQPAKAGSETSQPGVNRPSAARPTEYEADARGGSTPWNDPETRR